MRIICDENGTVEGLQKILNEVVADPNVKSIMIMSCDANGYSPDTIDPILNSITIPAIGGIFPSVIHGKSRLSRGSVVVGMSNEIDLAVVDGLSNQNSDFEELIDAAAPNTDAVKTLLVFVDGFATRIGSFLEGMFMVFGLDINYIGGGAGSLDMKQKPCLFTNEGMLEDAAVLALLRSESGIGVSHGWRSISGPHKVTRSAGNTIEALDSKPPFEIYQSVVNEHSGRTIDPERFFDVAKGYPFGIAKMEAESVVRDPLMVGDDGSLVCVGEVPEGVFVDILNGDKESLVSAAKEARHLGESSYEGEGQADLTLFIDCISRVLFLEDTFDEELAAVYREGVPLVGACTIGEIANNGRDYLEFHNKTSVVGVLGSL